MDNLNGPEQEVQRGAALRGGSNGRKCDSCLNPIVADFFLNLTMQVFEESSDLARQLGIQKRLPSEPYEA